jgi:hypothetical protein
MANEEGSNHNSFCKGFGFKMTSNNICNNVKKGNACYIFLGILFILFMTVIAIMVNADKNKPIGECDLER